MILAQPPPASFDPFGLTNYRWSEPFLYIIAVSSLIFGLFLFASYLKNRKKNLLLWTFAFSGLWIFTHQLIVTGSWTRLFGVFDTSMFGIYTAMLLALVPGFLAAGLCYDKDEKFGLYYTLYVLVMSLAYICVLLSPNSKLIAEAALIGARGNSGVIFAQFLNGINEETCDCQSISLKDFATTLKNSVNGLYKAIANPVEGTMLTVIREWTEFMYNQKDALDFRTVFINSLEVAEKSLMETPEKLKVLSKFNVVDAGAKGFVVFLQGILDFLKH